MSSKLLWKPDHDRRLSSLMARFMDAAGHDGYEALHSWSVNSPEQFWALTWNFTGMIGDDGTNRDGSDGGVVIERGAEFADTRFFPAATLNIAENLLSRDDDGPAIIARDETSKRSEISWSDLHTAVGAAAAALAAHGVVAGSRVAAVAANTIETVIATIAVAALGGTVSTTSPDFGASGIIDRFGQIEPVLLLTCDGYSYGGKWFDTTAKMARVAAALGDVPTLSLEAIATWTAPYIGAELPTTRYPFDQPWYVLYSSGTTGRPKCIEHRAGGVLLQHRKEQQLHCDIRPGDRVMYFTTTGWMMWNWLVSCLASGATIVLFDGQPFHPHDGVLFDVVDEEQVTLLGVSAKWIDAQRNAGASPRTTHSLASLRTICSTGSPLVPAGFEWVYEHVKTDLHLASIAGGTDLVACLMAGDPTSPVYSGEIQRPTLGMDTDSVESGGASLRDQPGVPGELVCRTPFPSMPLRFIGDPDGSKYRAAYFERFPGMWAHGDFVSWTEHGGFVIHGRSDATLNPGGVRIGTSDIYRAVESLPEISESLAFGQNTDGGDVRIILLVVPAPGVHLDDKLIGAVKSAIREQCSPRHVPAIVLAVADLPRTRSNKLVELAVADVVNGREVRNVEALANPEALWAIRDHPALH